MGRFLYDLGRSLQRLSGFLFLAAVVGLPLAVLMPHRPGLVLVLALVAAGFLRVALHRPRPGNTAPKLREVLCV